MDFQNLKQKIKDFIVKLQALDEKQKKIIMWTIVGILAVIMGIFWIKGTLYKIENMGEINLGFSEMEIIKTTEIENIIGNLSEQTLNWKTYINEEYGFEIKYPKEWDNVDDSGLGNIFFGCPQIKMGGSLSCPLSIDIISLSDNPTINDYLSNISSTDEENINGLKIVIYAGEDDLGEKSSIAFIYGYGEEYLVLIEDYEQNYQTSGIFQQILSTFKFIK